MAAQAIGGLWASAPTPFLADLSLDLRGMAGNLRMWSGSMGLDGLILGAAEGERAALSPDERLQILSHAREAVDGRCGLALDCTDGREDVAAALVRAAADRGAVALLGLPLLPGARAQDETVAAQVERLAALAGVGLIVDIGPGAGYLAAPRLAARLAGVPGVVALRYAAPPPLRAELAALLAGGPPVSAGDDRLWRDEIAAGGVALHLGGVAPLLMQSPADRGLARMAAAARAGHLDEAEAEDDRLEALRAAMRTACPAEKPVAFAKHWLECAGLAGGPVRPPWLPLTPREAARIARAFADHAPS